MEANTYLAVCMASKVAGMPAVACEIRRYLSQRIQECLGRQAERMLEGGTSPIKAAAHRRCQWMRRR